MTNEDGRRATALAQPQIGRSFIQLCMGEGGAQLNFTGDFGITLESPVRIGPDSENPVLPYALEGIALLLPLLNADVTAVHVSDNGALELTVGGTAIHCAPVAHFEAWNVAGPGGRLVVSLPSGGLAIWDAV